MARTYQQIKQQMTVWMDNIGSKSYATHQEQIEEAESLKAQFKDNRRPKFQKPEVWLVETENAFNLVSFKMISTLQTFKWELNVSTRNRAMTEDEKNRARADAQSAYERAVRNPQSNEFNRYA